MKANATMTTLVVQVDGKLRTRRFVGVAQPDGSILLPNGIRVRR